MRLDQDDRRLMFADIFPECSGDINVTILEPDALCAWHRHEHQHDAFFVLQGSVKFGIIDAKESDVLWVVGSECNPRVIPVEEGLWHGYQNIGPGRAMVLMRLSQKYNPEDEHRMTITEGEELFGAYWKRDVR